MRRNWILSLLTWVAAISGEEQLLGSESLISDDSPIEWNAMVRDSKGDRTLGGIEVNSLLQRGISDKALGVSCSLRLEKGFTKILEQRLYRETIFFDCNVKNVPVTISAVGCMPDPTERVCDPPARDSKSIFFGKDSRLSLTIFCKPKKGDISKKRSQ